MRTAPPLLMLAAAAVLYSAAPAAATAAGIMPHGHPHQQDRFITCPACEEDAHVWYYETAGKDLFFIDVNWPKPWGGACPAQGVTSIKPLLEPVPPSALARLPGRLTGGSGSPCHPPCQHFNCSLLPPHWTPPPAPIPPPPLPADEWAKLYRNWTYFPSWAIPPSCLDPTTCPNVRSNFTDIAQAWRVPGDNSWRMTYTFFDGVGYQTAMATSSDLLHWDQSPGTIYSPRERRPPLSWNATRAWIKPVPVH